jgi:hypothetical protein
MNNFRNKNILFLDGLNNLYHVGLINAFKSLGINVTPLVYSDFMHRSNLAKFNKNVFGINYKFNEDKFFNSIQGHYDLVFVKNPESVSKDIFIKLKEKYPNIPFINYNWNTINLLDYTAYIPLFDKVYTFDAYDANKYNLAYYPLFYLPAFEKIAINNLKKEYSVSFVGSTFTTGRPAFLSNFNRLIKEKNLSSFQHLHAFPKLYYTNKIFSRYNFNKLLTKKYLSQQEFLEICKRSLAFIDHPSEDQKGHTIRTFETLAAGMMLVTTNKELLKEPFYDSSRIQIIKEDFSDLNLDTLLNFQPSFPQGFEKYRVDNWLATILEQHL